MAWHTGTYRCGHPGRTQIYGPNKDREWQAQKHFERLCPDCWKAEQEHKAAETAERIKEMNLPALTGSEKQIAWAESLRAKYIGKAEYTISVNSEASAKWWLDNRDTMLHHTDYRRMIAKAKQTEELIETGKIPKPESPIIPKGTPPAEAIQILNDYITTHTAPTA